MAVNTDHVPNAATQEHLMAIQTIAHHAASSNDLELPHVLVRLYPIIVTSTDISFKDLRKLKEHIWLSDLLHVLVEVLRQDFSALRDGWNTAKQLAMTLESVCSGLHPSINSGSKPEVSEAVTEYYEILLPTAIDSILIVASNMLQAIAEHTCNACDYFENIIDSLLSVCRHHKACVQRVLQSPYLLHMVITDSTDLANVVLAALGELIKINQQCLTTLPPETLYSILDEFVYRMSGSDLKSATISLEIMASISSTDVGMIDLMVSRYRELLVTVRKWVDDPLGANVKHFVKEVEARTVTKTNVEREKQAAILIQASWRGYSARNKMKRINNGIRLFQQFYRRWKANRKRSQEKERKQKQVWSTKHETIKKGRMTFWEGQLSLVEELPPADVTAFVEQQEIKAATKIQSYWRRYVLQKRNNELRDEKHLTNSASVIQRAYRQFSLRKKQTFTSRAHTLHRVEGLERNHLQQEISTFRESHGHSDKSDSDKKKLHEHVQSLLEQFYLSRPCEDRKSDQRKIVVSQLDRSNGILSSAPTLNESFDRKEITDIFSSGSNSVARMAQIAHREELKCTDTPWWKLPRD